MKTGTIRWLAAGFILIFAFAACSDIPPQKQGVSEEQDEKPAIEEIEKEQNNRFVPEIGTSLFDFAFIAEEDVFELPCDIAAFLDSGWQCLSDLENEVLQPDEIGETFIVKNNNKLNITLINSYNKEIYAENAQVCAVSVDVESGNIMLPGEISVESSKQDILKIFDEPDNNIKNTINKLNYVQNKNSFVNFYFDSNDKLAKIEICNYYKKIEYDYSDIIFPENVLKWQGAESVPSNSNEWKSYIFKLDGDCYVLPAPVKELLDNGWEFVDENNYEKIVEANGYVISAYIRKGNNIMRINMENYSDEKQPYAACFITMVQSSADGADIDIELAGGVNRKSGSDKIKLAYGNEFTSYDSNGLKNIVYKSENGQMRFSFSDYGQENEKLVYIQLNNE